MNLLFAMRCMRISRKLSVYLDLENGSQLTSRELESISHHLSECQKCTRTLKELASMKGALGSLRKGFAHDTKQLESIKEKLSALLEGIEE